VESQSHKSKKIPVATYAILALNVAVFLLMVKARFPSNVNGALGLTWDSQFLLGWGGNLGPLSLHGQPWRLLTATYVHSGPLHIFFNMGALLGWGSLLERRFGSFRFVVFYTIAGLCGSLVSALVFANTVSVGASGALMGLMGAICAIWLWDKSIMNRRQLISMIPMTVLINFVPGIDWAAHAGGFAFGAMTGLVLGLGRNKTVQPLAA
jgi:rhomboid protease GluP